MKIRSISATAAWRHNFDVAKLVTAFEAVGITLANPHTHVVTGYNVEGERLVFDPTSSMDSILRSCHGLQAWFDDSTDVFFSWSREGATLRAHVEGLSAEQAEIVARVMLSELSAQGVHGQFEAAFALDSSKD